MSQTLTTNSGSEILDNQLMKIIFYMIFIIYLFKILDKNNVIHPSTKVLPTYLSYLDISYRTAQNVY